MLARRITYSAVVILAAFATWFQITHQKTTAAYSRTQSAIPASTSPDATKRLVPDFKLVERTGKSVTLADLKGKVWVADFFYASCPGPCPMISSRLSSLQAEALKNDDVRLVSISTQPDTDTPGVLRQYAEKFHASDKWLFLTGEKSEIYKLSNSGFLLTAMEQKDTGQGPIIHSTKLVLVDKTGTIRGYYDGADETNLKIILEEINKLRAE